MLLAGNIAVKALPSGAMTERATTADDQQEAGSASCAVAS